MLTETRQTQANSRVTSPALIISAIASGLVILVSLFRWTIVEYLTPFLEPFLEMAIAGFLVIALIWSIVHCLKAWGRGLAFAFLPLIVCLLTAAIAIFVPFNELTTNVDFRVHYNARMAVVSDVLAGRYDKYIESTGGSGDLIALPTKLAYLSSGGGEIIRLRKQDRTLILFFSFRGVLDSFSGFVYSSDNLAPSNGDFLANFVEVIPLRKNWFWVASRN
ncbi:MAG TPA: hypothetical protein VJ731_15995 [Terriglobales bacterium]|nr:hypothetical protein [Terriglobales bacterium]